MTSSQTSGAGQPLTHVMVMVAVQTSSDAAAQETVERLLRVALEGRARHAEDEPGVPSVQGWWLTAGSQLDGWMPYIDSGIPEIVAHMFPPEPNAQDFHTAHGEFDQDSFEGELEDWMDHSLTLAHRTAGLPELLERLEQSERVRDRIIDVLQRHPLPSRPNRQHFQASPERNSFGMRFDERAFERAHASWQSRFYQAVRTREAAIEQILAEDADAGATARALDSMVVSDTQRRSEDDAEGTMLERGVLLSELLRSRDQTLDPDKAHEHPATASDGPTR